MEKSKARKELEHYFAVRKEARERFKSGTLDYLHYKIRVNYLAEVLSERSYMAFMALREAIERIQNRPLKTYEQTNRANALRENDHERYDEWRREFMRTNVERLAYANLAAAESVVIPEIPEPRSKEELEARRLERARAAAKNSVDTSCPNASNTTHENREHLQQCYAKPVFD